MAYKSQPTVTRPANQTPYQGGDVVGGVITFPDMASTIGRDIFITSADLRIDVSAVPSGMTSFTLHLYKKTPPSALADNAVWKGDAADKAHYLGKLDLGSPALAGTGGAWLFTQADGNNKQLRLASDETSLYGYLVTNGGFTPAANSEVYVPTLYAIEERN
jgi:hypothetical protein